MSEREQDTIRGQFPKKTSIFMEPARPFVRGAKLKRLVERHLVNNKPFLDRNYEIFDQISQFASTA